MPAERREPVLQRLEAGHLGRWTVGLLVVDVDDADQVIELVVARRPGALPDRALAQLAVREQAVDEGVRLLALQPQAEPDSERQPVAERAAGDLHARRVGRHAGHGQAAVVGAIGLHFVLGNDAGLDQRRVERDGVVADREQEAVAALPLRVVRAVAHGMEVRHREHVGDAERLGDVALALHLAHEQCFSPDAVGPVHQ